MTPKTLGEALARLKEAAVVRRPAREDWSDMIARTTVPGRVAEVDRETYDYFLEVLPPRWMGKGGFAFGEGSDPLRLFWADGGRCYCRQLNDEESALFCKLAGIPLSSG
jgi:hypothetical protein